MRAGIIVGVVAVPLGAVCVQDTHTPPPGHGHAQEVRHSGDLTASETTTVPAIKYGTSVKDALQQLARAGLCADAPNLDYPHYVTGANPSAGTDAKRGSLITLMVGDG